MVKADENASKALEELKQAQVHNKKSGKCMYFLVTIILLCIVVLGLILFL